MKKSAKIVIALNTMLITISCSSCFQENNSSYDSGIESQILESSITELNSIDESDFVSADQEVSGEYSRTSEESIIIEILDDFIPKGMKIYELLNYAPFIKTSVETVQKYKTYYMPANIEGFSNIKEIKEKMAEIFTKGYLQNEFYNMYFDNNEYGPKFIEINGALYYCNDYVYGGYPVWRTDTLKIVKQNNDEIIVEMNIDYYIDDNKIISSEKEELSLKKEDNTWKINSSLHCWD